MNTFIQRHRLTSGAAALLLLGFGAAFAMPTQAAQLSDKAVSVMGHLCQRFCGCHHHHHGHTWCGGHEDYWCPGHH